MSWDDDAYDEVARGPRRPASARRVLLEISGYVGVVVAVFVLIAGVITAVTVVGGAMNPEGFAAPSARGQGVSLPPVTPAAGADAGEDGGASTREPAAVTGSEVAPMAAPEVEVEDDWVARTAAATGIPPRALSAYALAHVSIAGSDPECGLDWTTIAAIGAVESGHGSHGDAVLEDDGTVRPAIIGPALDGDGVAAIRDTDGGTLDGDVTWDRAVGPMQFIPATWGDWGADANGDGIADPSQIDDAAHAAAGYLCASGPMTTPEGWRAAVFSYNHDDDYVDKVATIANGYVASAG